MDMLKQNKFWVGIGASVVLLLVLFGVLVVPLWGEEDTLRGRIRFLKNQVAPLAPPGDPDIREYEEYRSRIIKGYKLITSFYAESDKRLERWFNGLPDPPARGLFMTRYQDELKQMETSLREKGTRVGIKMAPEDPEEKPRHGFNWEEPDQSHFSAAAAAGGDEVEILKTLQKRFWARQRLANAILEGNVKVHRVVDFRFFQQLHPAITNAPWKAMPSGKYAPTYLAMGEAGPGGFGRGFREYGLPNNLGRTMTFGFAVELPYSEVPKVISEMLNPGTEGGPSERLLLNVVGVHVTVRDQNDPKKDFYYTEGNLSEKREKEEAAREEVEPVPVLMTLTCQLLDFDPSQVLDEEDFQKIEDERAGQAKP